MISLMEVLEITKAIMQNIQNIFLIITILFMLDHKRNLYLYIEVINNKKD